MRTGALITIAVVLAVVVLLYFRPWTSSDDGYPYSSPYGLGPGVASLHGGGQR